MSKNPAKTLELLFAIEADVIKRDLRLAEDNLPGFGEESQALRGIPFSALTPEIEARRSHLFMVQAHELCRRDTIAPEVQVFYAAFGAGQASQDAELLTSDSATCAELADRMDVIRRREGLEADEDWLVNDGPEDYRKLNDQYGQVLERVYETVFVFMLRRYQLNSQADLFERDWVSFEIQREVGRRVILSNTNETADVEKLLDAYFRREYGETAFQHILQRVKEIREKGRG